MLETANLEPFEPSQPQPETPRQSEPQLPPEAQGEVNGGPLGCCLGVTVGLLLSLSAAKDLRPRRANRWGTEILRCAQDDRGWASPQTYQSIWRCGGRTGIYFCCVRSNT